LDIGARIWRPARYDSM